MTPSNELKKQAMSAVANVQKIAHVGLAKVTVGAAVYAAHIRQMDGQKRSRQRQVRRDAIGREI